MKYFLLNVIIVAVGAAVDQCRTQEGNTGDCILLDECIPLKEMNRRNPPKRHEIEYLRKASCGLHLFKPKVCCPRDWSIFATSTTQKVLDSTSATTISATLETSIAAQTSDEAPFKVREPVYTANYSGSCPPTAAPPLPASQCCGLEVGNNERITGGQDTGIDQYPWLALLVYENPNTLCAGSLISSRYVLTAAHCFDEKRLGKIAYIRLAEYNRTSHPEDCIATAGNGIDCVKSMEIRVEKIIVHPNYFAGDASKRNDIGLAKLSWNAPYTDFIRPICLPFADITTNPEKNLRFFVAGWGWDGSTYSEVKQHTTLQYVPILECQKLYEVTNSRFSLELWVRQICAGGEDLRDSCKGDSGGPLMHEIGNTFVIVGVVSFGPQRCGTAGKPGIYTYVYPYLDWIKSEATL